MDIERAIIVLNNMILDGIIMTEDETKAIETAVYILPELLQYRKIGTVDECRAAREKQTPKEPSFYHKESTLFAGWTCPECGYIVGEQYVPRKHNQHKSNFCSRCGQALKWGD